MKNKIIGICHICGQTKELTEEHIPPRAAGNTKTIKYHTMNDILQQDKKQDFKYHLSQGGFHVPTICNDCNNNTGSFYAPAYSEFANAIMRSLYKNNIDEMLNHKLNFKCQFKPLNVFKQIITMFCSILEPEVVAINKFGDFVLDKNTNILNSKPFKLHMFLVPNETFKILPTYGIFNTNTGKYILLSEFIAPPFGFVLNLSPESVSLDLPEITSFCNCSYDEISVFEFNIPFLRPLQFFMKFDGMPQENIISW